MLERKVEGVAVLTFGEEEPVLGQLAHHDIPIVLAEFHLEGSKTSTILLDYTTGIRAAVGHLADLGHRKIAFLSGPRKLHSAVTRANDYMATMEAAGLPVEKKWMVECDHTLKGESRLVLLASKSMESTTSPLKSRRNTVPPVCDE